MPILNPILQYHLLKTPYKIIAKDQIGFYMRYLHIASRNVQKNFSTIQTSLLFQEDLQASIELINFKFGCKSTENDFNNPTITNYYKYFLNLIRNSTSFDSRNGVKLEGIYIKQSGDSSIKFFQPNIYYSTHHCWLFSSTPVAILCINLDNFSFEKAHYSFFQTIKLESDLLIASGFTLALCSNYRDKSSQYLFELMFRNQFSEIHFNFDDTSKAEHFLNELKKNYENKLDLFKGYFYFYTPFLNKESESYKILKKIKQRPRFTVFTFAIDIESALKTTSFVQTRPFPYCKSGFKYDKLLIWLSNVPIYDNDIDDENFVPSETSGLSKCYISPNDFLNWENKRVKIIYDDAENNHSYEKYVDFDDIHKIQKDLYVKDTLMITKIERETLENINKMEKEIKSIVKKRRKKEFKKQMIFSIFEDKLIKNSIEYVAYAYACTNSLKKMFYIHRPQLYTVLQASKSLLSKKKYSQKILLKQKKILEDFMHSNSNNNINEVFSQNLVGLLSNQSISNEIKEFLIKNSKPNNYKDNLLKFNPTKFSDNDSIKKEINKIEAKLKKSNFDNSKGIIYQVETGEGKSCIISLIAAILALNGKTVHITSSNIKLSNRDYIESFDFFKLLNLKSAVLLHDNELPYNIKKKKINQNKANEKKFSSNNNNSHINSLFKNNAENYYNTYTNEENNIEYSRFYKSSDFDYYDEKQFKNPSRMNFAVCGLDCNNNIPKNKPNIIFSTFVNFECFYLKMLEICPGYVEVYFDQCALLIDEADSILIDEITNGTIISKEMRSNSKDVLKFVYHNRMEKISEEDTFNAIKEKWPKCVDLSLDDVRKMYSEIDLVNQDEFKNGKKYSIEEFEVKSNKKKKRLVRQTLRLAKKIAIKVGKGLMNNLLDNENNADENIVLNNEEEIIDKNDAVDDENDNNNGDENSNDDDDGGDDIDAQDNNNDEIDDTNNDDDNLDEDKNEDAGENEDEDEDEEEEEDINEDDCPSTVYKYIVPFDYDHKGIIEPNKEFSGFIQQFIAIKESENNKVNNMIIKDISISYLYASHPVFVQLYGKVCGFTGTIGTKKDRDVYKEQYNLTTQKVPRNKPNLRVEFPMILCKSFHERNQKIVYEILKFHKKGNPVLVIFQDLNEILDVGNLLNLNGIHYFNVFDGKNENVTPEIIAGKESAISLGTNVCGRGTNIIAKGKSLHVIISYYTSNLRVINQAHGRTARQGQKGTSRIICLREQFLYPTLFVDNGMKEVIEEFRIKDQLQHEYIELFKALKPWIFSNDIEKQKLNDDDIIKMRSAKININRIVAYNFEFPIKMSIETFLKIQAQKIFSILNCPNSKYTWKLFQRYVREMILESWSLMINKVDDTFFEKDENREYKKEIDEFKDLTLSMNPKHYENQMKKLNEKFSDVFKRYEIELKQNRNNLLDLLNEYLPFDKRHIVPCFMHIFNKVINQYESPILKSFKTMADAYLSNDKIGFLSCQVGFRPFSLMSESGARISYTNLRRANYIKDPELKYLKKLPNNKICLLSITEKIDDIFNQIFQRINRFLGKKTYLKLFMRRTLCGCEFGICFNFNSENEGFNDPNCLVDKDPLILFTLSVKSMVPILAGILIIILVYLSGIAKNLIEWIGAFPEKLTKELLKKGLFIIVDIVSSELVNHFLDKGIMFLKKSLESQLEKLRAIESSSYQLAAEIIEKIALIFDSAIGEAINTKITSLLGDKIKATLSWQKALKNCFDPLRVMKFSILILLCVATFIMNFNTRKDAIKHAKDDSSEYNKSLKEDKDIDKTLNKLKKKNEEEFNKDAGNKLKNDESQDDKDKIDQFNKSYNVVSNTLLYKYRKYELSEKIDKITEIYDENVQFLSDYSGFKELLDRKVRILITNKCSWIINLIGNSAQKKKQKSFIENKGNGTLQDIIDNHSDIDLTTKLIIAYGTACAMESLHANKIVHRNLKPENIVLDKKFHTYLSDFFYAIQIDAKLPYILEEVQPEFMAPEFIVDYKTNQKSFKIDVYAYGIILFMLISGKNPFANCTRQEILDNTKNGKRPQFDKGIDKNWKKLIAKCWIQNPSERPDFTEICNTFENKFIKCEIDLNTFKKYQKMIQRQPNNS